MGSRAVGRPRAVASVSPSDAELLERVDDEAGEEDRPGDLDPRRHRLGQLALTPLKMSDESLDARRTLTMHSSSRATVESSMAACDPIRTMRRECETYCGMSVNLPRRLTDLVVLSRRWERPGEDEREAD